METNAPGSSGDGAQLTIAATARDIEIAGPALAACNRLYEKGRKPEEVSSLTFHLEMWEVQKDQLQGPGNPHYHEALTSMWLLRNKPRSPEYEAFYAARKAQEERADNAAQKLCKAVDDVCREFASGNMSINSLVMEVWKTVGGDESAKATAEEWYHRRR